MKRILFPTYYGNNDIASFNCAHGPFSMLKNEVEIVVPFIEDGKNHLESGWWTNFRHWMGIDVCFLHRPSGWYGQQIIRAAKSHHIPLWVHHDDDLLEIPKTNPYYNIVRHEEEYPSVIESYVEADILSCQSVLMKQMLVDKYERHDTFLIPISLDDRLIPLKKPWTNNNRICWRGSDSHRHDLLTFKIELQEIFDKYQDMEFHFFVLNPRELGFKVKKLIFHQGVPMIEFYNKIVEINAAYHIVLLEDNPFNRVKSHLAWLDATLAGSAVFGPDYPEFHRSGCRVFPNDFHSFLETTDKQCLNEISWASIQNNYLNSITNKTRLEILRNV